MPHVVSRGHTKTRREIIELDNNISNSQQQKYDREIALFASDKSGTIRDNKLTSREY